MNERKTQLMVEILEAEAEIERLRNLVREKEIEWAEAASGLKPGMTISYTRQRKTEVGQVESLRRAWGTTWTVTVNPLKGNGDPSRQRRTVYSDDNVKVIDPTITAQATH